MLTSLILPVILATVALFFASFLSWTVLPVHHKDWARLKQEDKFMKAAAELEIPAGSYMFPRWETAEEMKSKEFAQKWEAGPTGIMTIFPNVNMGKNLGLTLLYFLCVNFCLAYLATLAVKPGEEFLGVFRFVATAGLMTFFAAIVQHAIWFHNRIIGHLIESLAYAAITGLIFAAMWPGA